MKVAGVAAIRLACQDIRAVREFYHSVFGCRVCEHLSLVLGEQRIELFESAARPLVPAPANSTAFQHFAIVVSDMDKAIAALHGQRGWTPISRGGPQRLPATSGGVIAFKFRDPEGHPLELLQFPRTAIPEAWKPRDAQVFLGIDHSAITVEQTARAVAFYERLGFVMAGGQQLNRGIEQEQLDDLSGAIVEVSAMMIPGNTTPHLELLCYRMPPTVAPPSGADQTQTRLVVDVDSLQRPSSSASEFYEEVISDSDGHLLVLKHLKVS